MNIINEISIIDNETTNLITNLDTNEILIIEDETTKIITVLDENNQLIEISDENMNFQFTDEIIYFGNSNSIPLNGDDVKNLQNKLLSNEYNFITLETGNINKIFVVALPSTKEIDLVLDENAMFVDITRCYLKTNIIVENIDGIEKNYNVYIMQNAIPYTRNHKHKITFNNL